MDKFVIEGGHPLEGTVRVAGAKNAVLPVMAAALLTGDELAIENAPKLSDVPYPVQMEPNLVVEFYSR